MNVIASKGICNTASINIYEIIYGIDDCVLVGINNDKNKPRKHKLYYTDEDAYFNFHGHREYLSQYMRIK